MSVSKEEVLDSIAQMSVTEVMELVAMMEKRFGVSAAMAAPVAATNAGGDSPEVEEKDSFTVVLSSFNTQKVAVIKAVRAMTSLGLKEAKDLVEGVPSTVHENVSKEEADKYKAQLEEAGASVELK